MDRSSRSSKSMYMVYLILQCCLFEYVIFMNLEKFEGIVSMSVLVVLHVILCFVHVI